jgi:L-iditol 2-dehydrogenase
MKAAVWYGGRDVRIEDVPKPDIESNDALVRVRSVGICGSELHAYEGISKRRKPPLIMGHEFSGEVAEVGREVKNSELGDRVVVDPVTRCGACEQCLRGQGNVCRNLRLLGLHKPGAYAEYVLAPAMNCYKLPNGVSFEEGSMVEPLAVAVHAVNRTPIKLGDKVVVIGAGIIGLMVLQAAKAAGAESVFITDVLDYKLDLARNLGADLAINSKTEDSVERIKEVTDGHGADVVLEAVGLEATVRDAMNVLDRGGRLTILGNLAQTMTLEIMDAVVKEFDIKGSYCYTHDDFKKALDFIKDRRINVKTLITNVLPLDEAEKGFELLHEKKERVLKVLLKP